MKYDYLIVGAGFAGSVCAQQLAEAGKTVLLVDQRPHIGGNAYDCHDAFGVLIHPYGPHIFHTHAKRIFDYLSQFTEWRFYEHRVLASVDNQLVPVPINLTTLQRLYGIETEAAAEQYLARVRVDIKDIKTSEDVVLSSVGHDLCEKIFRGYTRKQWGLDISQLSAGVAARIPTRTNNDDRYFTDTFQFMPAKGYTEMFKRMLDHEHIEIQLSTDFKSVRECCAYDALIYTGPIDAYFDYAFGPLPYRSLRFEHEHLSQIEIYQPVGTVNYPNQHAFTRITEFKHMTGQTCSGTSIVREYPLAEGDPFYPIPRAENEDIYKKYEQRAKTESNTYFVGRLAQYRYYNMDQVVGAALKTVQEILKQGAG